MIHPMLAALKEVSSGETITAHQYNAIVRAVKISMTGTMLQVTPQGWLFRTPSSQASGLKWVIIRPPIELGKLSVMAEDAVRHPQYGIEGPNKGRWIAASESNGGIPSLTEYPVWPHRQSDFYVEYAWDGLTVIRETQILAAHYVIDAWYIHPDPPILVRAYPHTSVRTPCSPQQEIP